MSKFQSLSSNRHSAGRQALQRCANSVITGVSETNTLSDNLSNNTSDTIYSNLNLNESLLDLIKEWKENDLEGDNNYYYLATTLAFNNNIECRTKAESHLRAFNVRINRKLLSRNWYKPKNYDRQVEFFAFPEKWKTNPHYHLIVKCEKSLVHDYRKSIKSIWEKIVPSGTVHWGEGGVDWPYYITKEFSSHEHMIFSRQWRSV